MPTGDPEGNIGKPQIGDRGLGIIGVRKMNFRNTARGFVDGDHGRADPEESRMRFVKALFQEV
jgi:hypothetical protein